MAETRVQCPSCGAGLKLAAPVPPGKAIRCPSCGATVRPPPAAQSSGFSAHAPRPSRPRILDDDVPEAERAEGGAGQRPRPPRRYSFRRDKGPSRAALWLGIAGATILAAAVVLFLVFKGGSHKNAPPDRGNAGEDTVWEGRDGFEVRLEGSFPTDAKRAAHLAVTGDGKIAVISGEEASNKVRIFDLDKKQQLAAFTPATDVAAAVCVSPDKAWLACYREQGHEVELRELATGALVHTLAWKGPRAFVGFRGLAFSPGSDRLIAAYADSLLGWECKSGRQAFAWKAHEIQVISMGVRPDGSVVTVGEDGVLKIWDLDRGTATRTIRLGGGRTEQLVLSPDGRLAAHKRNEGGFGLTNIICVWDLDRATRLVRVESRAFTEALRMWLLADDRTLLTALPLAVAFWDATNGNLKLDLDREPTLEKQNEKAVRDVAVASDGTLFLLRNNGTLQRVRVKN